ncbi:MAG: GH3 auxin-responsive promoter family protein [Flavobacteriales bacterium]
MSISNSLITWVLKKRYQQVEFFMNHPHEVQKRILNDLIDAAQHTEFGKKHAFKDIYSYNDFSKNVPLYSYEELFPYINKTLQGQENVLWPGETKWFAKSSGTTNDKSKFIPVSKEALFDCHYKSGKDMLAIHCNEFKKTKVFDGKCLILGGSREINHLNKNSYIGDLSAILVDNLPFLISKRRSPDKKTALMGNWEEKLERMSDIAIKENIRTLAGVPSWTLVFLKKVLEKTGKENIEEVWPEIEMFMHGGVKFDPYIEQYKKLFPSGKMKYLETYNASEGYFGLQLESKVRDMLLLLDNGIFYEFIPLSEVDKEYPKVLPLYEVEINKAYAMIISTNAGLWRYALGDTIKFTSTTPYRFIILGRTKFCINAFGEELMIDNVEKAIQIVSEKLKVKINDYTAAPVFMDKGSGAHEWVIEFEENPKDLNYFTESLDNALKTLNSDYEAKRYKNMVLHKPEVTTVARGTFYKWFKSKDKLGGQNKIPRLSNDRIFVEEIKKFTAQ